jgi:hypothetical protein
MVAACVNKDLDNLLWDRENRKKQLLKQRREVFILREKQKGFGLRLLSVKTSRETRSLKQKGENKKGI